MLVDLLDIKLGSIYCQSKLVVERTCTCNRISSKIRRTEKCKSIEKTRYDGHEQQWTITKASVDQYIRSEAFRGLN